MRELMRSFIARSHEPNAESLQAMREVEEELLIYRIIDDAVYFVRTASHAELLGL